MSGHCGSERDELVELGPECSESGAQLVGLASEPDAEVLGRKFEPGAGDNEGAAPLREVEVKALCFAVGGVDDPWEADDAGLGGASPGAGGC